MMLLLGAHAGNRANSVDTAFDGVYRRLKRAVAGLVANEALATKRVVMFWQVVVRGARTSDAAWQIRGSYRIEQAACITRGS